MLYKDDFGNLHTIGQFVDTQVVSLTANTASSVTLDENAIYRIVSDATIYIKQGTSSVTATTSECKILYDREEFFNTFGGAKYISIISASDCSVYITKMS